MLLLSGQLFSTSICRIKVFFFFEGYFLQLPRADLVESSQTYDKFDLFAVELCSLLVFYLLGIIGLKFIFLNKKNIFKVPSN
jgi:hypothetical protein